VLRVLNESLAGAIACRLVAPGGTLTNLPRRDCGPVTTTSLTPRAIGAVKSTRCRRSGEIVASTTATSPRPESSISSILSRVVGTNTTWMRRGPVLRRAFLSYSAMYSYEMPRWVPPVSTKYMVLLYGTSARIKRRSTMPSRGMDGILDGGGAILARAFHEGSR
jgi:hypothetical protein